MGAVAQPIPFVDVSGNRFAAYENSHKNRSLVEHGVEFLSSSNGAFRSMQFLERVSKICSLALKESSSATAAFFDGVASKLGLAWAMLTIPRLPFVTKAAWKAISEWRVVNQGPITSANRNIMQRIHDVADAMAAWGYATSLIFSSSALKNAADVPNFVADMTDLSMAAEDYSLASRHLEHINVNDARNGALQHRFLDTMREALLRIVKATASVVSGVLGLLVLALGGPIVPGTALLAIGMTSTLAALAAHFFKETRSYEKVDFFKFRAPQVLVEGAFAN